MFSPTIVAAVISILFGIAPIIHRHVTQHVSKGFIMLVSGVVYFISIIAYIFLFEQKAVVVDIKENKRYILLLAVTTFLSLFMANILYLYVMKHAKNVNIVVIIMAMYPAITLLLAIVFLKEKLTLLGCLGFFIILTGLAVLLYSHKE